MHLIILSRCQNQVTVLTLWTGSIPWFFIKVSWHIVNNWILFKTTGTGETDNITGSRPNNLRPYWIFHHDVYLLDLFQEKRYKIVKSWLSYSGTKVCKAAYVPWWNCFFFVPSKGIEFSSIFLVVICWVVRGYIGSSILASHTLVPW